MFTLFDLTPYSIIAVTVVTSIFILFFILLTRKDSVITRLPMWLMMTLTVAMCLRLLFPIEFLFLSHAFLSFDILPQFDAAIKTSVNIFENTAASQIVSIVDIFCYAWLLGALFFTCSYFFKYFNLCRRVKYLETSDERLLNILNKVKDEYNFNFNVKIIVSSAVESPSEFGFFRQVVFLNDYNYTDEQLFYILSHELTHFYNKSNWIKLFLDIVSSVLWWNPVIHLLCEHINNVLEIYVDAHVIKDTDKKFKENYLLCLLDVYKMSFTGSNHTMEYVHPMAKSLDKNLLLKRFNLVTTKRAINIPMCISMFVILIIYIFVSTRYVIQPGYEPPAEDLIPVVTEFSEFTAENSYIIKEGDWYYLYYNDQRYIKTQDIKDLPNVPIITK